MRSAGAHEAAPGRGGAGRGCRVGDLDPGILLYLSETLGMTLKEVDAMLNKQSGLLGLCGYR